MVNAYNAPRFLQAAIKGTAPYVGFPQPGKQPFVVPRRKLELLLDDLFIRSAEFADGQLKVSGTRIGVAGALIKSRFSLPPMRINDWRSRERLQKEIGKWAEQQRVRREGKRNVLPKHQRAAVKTAEEIRKLEKKLTDQRTYKSLGTRLRYVPRSPLKLDLGRDSEDGSYYKYELEQAKHWYADKAKRKRIAQIVGPFLKDWKPKWQQVYKALAAEGFEVSERNKFSRIGRLKGGPTAETYLKHIFRYVNGNPHEIKPVGLRERGWRDELAKDHMNALIEYANAVREKKNIEHQIATLREMLKSYQEQEETVAA